MKKIFFALVILLLAGSLSACIKIKTNSTASSTGGVFKTSNRGQNWTPQVLIASVSDQKPSISGYNISALVLDPQDNQTIYAGTETNGLYISYDGATSWMQFPSLNTGYINSIIVHPKNKCSLYISSANRILQSVDCGRTWKQIYFDTRSDLKITTLAIDNFAPDIIYAGNSAGDVLQSKDGGATWATIKRINNRIVSIAIGADTRHVFVGTEYYGLVKSEDKGQTWIELPGPFNNKYDASQFTNMTIDYKNNVLLISTIYGILRSKDEGKTWEPVNLITSPGSTQIYSLAVNPFNAQEIYYGTGSTFYSTADGGQNWTSQQLPTASIANKLLVDPKKTDVIYMGFKKFDK